MGLGEILGGLPRRPAPSTTHDIDTRRQQVIDQIAALGPVVPGSLVSRSSRCGNPRCRCQTDPSAMHGPYLTWAHSINGRTATRALPTEQVDRARPWFDNAHRLRELVDELKQLGIEHAEADDQWPAS